MWYFRAIAFDLDGTLTTTDTIAADTLAQLRDARSDRAIVLVTGRIGAELNNVFPGLANRFDAIVTENGAVLHRLGSDRLLAPSVDPSVDKALADRGIPFRRGRVLLAVDAADAPAVSAVLADLGLDCQVVLNRDAAMVLPAGVTKGTGLLAALDELGLSPHNCVAVGDAQNDLALLQSAEVGVAVGNAVSVLADHADLRLTGTDGAAVASLLSSPLLVDHERLCPPRHWVQIGTFDNGEPAMLPGSQSSILIAGDSGSGKSYLAGLIAEQWIDAGYSLLIVDPEGDHAGLADRPGVHFVDAATTMPAPSELLALARAGRASVVLDLSGLGPEAKTSYLRRLPAAIAGERARHGVPHWVVYDEAHQHSWLVEYAREFETAVGPGTCVVTWQPQELPPGLLHTVEFVLSPRTGRPTDDNSPAWSTLSHQGGPTRQFAIAPRLSRHVRHLRKYATVPLPEHRRFYFNGEPGSPAIVAATIDEFARQLRHCDLATLEHHLSRGDFSRWISATIADHDLGAEVASAERDVRTRQAMVLEDARTQILCLVERRYSTP